MEISGDDLNIAYFFTFSFIYSYLKSNIKIINIISTTITVLVDDIQTFICFFICELSGCGEHPNITLIYLIRYNNF